MHLGNYLRNLLRSTAVNNHNPIILWKLHAQIVDFTSIKTFGQPKFAYIYRPPTTENRELQPRAKHTYFIEIESDKHLCPVFNPQIHCTDIIRPTDFCPSTQKNLPSLTALLNRLSRQRTYKNLKNSDTHNDETFRRALTFICRQTLRRGAWKTLAYHGSLATVLIHRTYAPLPTKNTKH